MRYELFAVVLVLLLGFRLVMFRRRRAARSAQDSSASNLSLSTTSDATVSDESVESAGTTVQPTGAVSPQADGVTGTERLPRPIRLGPFNHDFALVAAREIHERVRGRIFRIGTLVILAVVAGAILIPKLTHSASSPQDVGVVGTLSGAARADVLAAGSSDGISIRLHAEPDVAAARRDLNAGTIDLAIVNGRQVIVDTAITSSDTSDTATLVPTLAANLGVTQAFETAGLTPSQISELEGSKPVPVTSLHAAAGKAKKTTQQSTALIGLILTFVMLTQYNTWILIGVMEEKSSRVVEVLLAAVRPVRLLGGKVLGIGLVALAQASLLVAFALILAKAVGSTVLQGSAPLVIISSLLWLVLGYAFYCWVYASAGSMAERQDQVQSLAFPLSVPVIFGYIISLTTLESGHVSAFFKVLAYLPPTAPFAMPALVGLHDVAWWEFGLSAVLSIMGTVLVARLAARIYRRAILRTGRGVRWREVLSRASG